VAVSRLRERARAREQIPVHDDDQRPERNVLGQRERERQAALFQIDTPADCIERDSEQRTVRCMHDEAH
jgi:hypothetical protein